MKTFPTLEQQQSFEKQFNELIAKCSINVQKKWQEQGKVFNWKPVLGTPSFQNSLIILLKGNKLKQYKELINKLKERTI